MRLSPKQCQIASYGGSDKRWTLVSGPVGSGKTFAAGVGFTLNHSRWAGVEFGILTKSHAQLSSLLRQTLEPMAGYEINIDSEGSFTWPSPAGAPNRIRCFVAQDRRAEPRLRSFNLSGGLVEEMTTLPSGILAAMNARCRVGDAKILGLTNPDGPLHPVKVQYFDNLDLLNAQAIYTELADNDSLSDAYIESLSAHYIGHMRERMVYGRWAAASGLVYPHVLDVSGQRPHEDMVAYDVVIDVGEASVTCALLCGRTPTGATWVLDEWVHNHVIAGVLTERELVGAIRRQFSGHVIDSYIVDPAAKRFRQELLVQLGPSANVGKGENDWAEGVEEVNYWISRHALFIYGDRCPQLMANLGALIYDEEQAALGKDVPVKIPDHLTDCLRYLVLTRAIHEAGGRTVWEARRKASREIAP